MSKPARRKRSTHCRARSRVSSLESSRTWISSRSRGVVQPGHRFDQPFHHKQLVVDGELDGDRRELGELLFELGLSIPVSEVEVDQLIAVQPVDGQDSQYDKVGNQDGEIERVQAVLGAHPIQKGSVGA